MSQLQTRSEAWQETRQQVAFYLDDIGTPLGQFIALSLTTTILVSAGIFVIQTYDISAELRTRLMLLDQTILVCFAIEYGIRLWAAENRLKFCFKPLSIIDLVAILPFFLGFSNTGFLRIIRWFRVLRLIRFIDIKISVFQIHQEDGAILARIIFTLISIIFVFSGLIYQVEHPVNPEVFGTFLDALYFAVVTMTTVGFGDVIPQSEAGRFLTILMIFTGVVLIPWQIGDFVKQLLKTAEQVSVVCPQCGLSSHDADAQFCKQCGTQIK
ncbi:MAG: ion transporter [Microcoleaceae cyanobacterium]